MADVARPNIPALRVHQWLKSWDGVDFDEHAHRRRPEENFYVLSMPATQLRALCDIRRRTTAESRARNSDLNVQRRHNEDRSKEIREYVEHGFPWSSLSKRARASEEYRDLRKPGWLPSAIVVNVLVGPDLRDGQSVAAEDLIDIDAQGSDVSFKLPAGSSDPSWAPKRTAPIEVIDGQHRLWAFDKDESVDGGFDLPVVAFHGLDISWQAYLFYVINIKPTKINTSLAFDLYPLLRTEDWLEHAGGLQIYRESRAQELTEALWSFPDSPWHNRIDMLGETGRKHVTQAAWIRSLLATFVKMWESPRARVGGLFGAPTGDDEAVLPWTRSQQSAFLILLWQEFASAVEATSAPWATALRDAANVDSKSGDPALAGAGTLPNTDQGVRAFLAVMNDLCYVRTDELGLLGWTTNEFPEGTSVIGIRDALKSLRRQPVSQFVTAVCAQLAEYDWRTYSGPGLSLEEQRAKGRFRGSTGYRELRRDLLDHLAACSDPTVSGASNDVLSLLEWN